MNPVPHESAPSLLVAAKRLQEAQQYLALARQEGKWGDGRKPEQSDAARNAVRDIRGKIERQLARLETLLAAAADTPAGAPLNGPAEVAP